MLGGEIEYLFCKSFRFVERDQIIYDIREQILKNWVMSYGYMVLHFL
jgi:hypothetical protein